MTTVKKLIIETSEPSITMEMIPGGNFPAIEVIVRQEGKMIIGTIGKMSELKKLAEGMSTFTGLLLNESHHKEMILLNALERIKQQSDIESINKIATEVIDLLN